MAKGRGFEDIAAAMAIWGQVDRDAIANAGKAILDFGRVFLKENIFAKFGGIFKRFKDSFIGIRQSLGDISPFKYWKNFNFANLGKAMTNVTAIAYEQMKTGIKASPALKKTLRQSYQAIVVKAMEGFELYKKHPALVKLFAGFYAIRQAIVDRLADSKIGQAAEWVHTKFGNIRTAITKFGEKHQGLQLMGRVLWQFTGLPLVPKALKALKGLVTSFWEMAKMTAKGALVGSVIQAFTQLMECLNPLRPIIEMLAEIFGIWGEIIFAQLAPVLEQLFAILLSPSVLSLIETIGKLFAKLFEAIMPILDLLIRILVPILIPVLELFTGLLGMVAKGVKWVVDAITPFVDVIVGALVTGINFIGKAFWWLVDFVFKPVINAVIWIVNRFIDIINGIVRIATAGVVQNAVPQITYLAKGGIATKPTLAMIGEAGPEMVVPLNSSAAGNMGTPSITINISGNLVTERELVKIIDEHIATKLYTRRF